MLHASRSHTSPHCLPLPISFSYPWGIHLPTSCCLLLPSATFCLFPFHLYIFSAPTILHGHTFYYLLTLPTHPIALGGKRRKHYSSPCLPPATLLLETICLLSYNLLSPLLPASPSSPASLACLLPALGCFALALPPTVPCLRAGVTLQAFLCLLPPATAPATAHRPPTTLLASTGRDAARRASRRRAACATCGRGVAGEEHRRPCNGAQHTAGPGVASATGDPTTTAHTTFCPAPPPPPPAPACLHLAHLPRRRRRNHCLSCSCTTASLGRFRALWRAAYPCITAARGSNASAAAPSCLFPGYHLAFLPHSLPLSPPTTIALQPRTAAHLCRALAPLWLPAATTPAALATPAPWTHACM